MPKDDNICNGGFRLLQISIGMMPFKRSKEQFHELEMNRRRSKRFKIVKDHSLPHGDIDSNENDIFPSVQVHAETTQNLRSMKNKEHNHANIQRTIYLPNGK